MRRVDWDTFCEDKWTEACNIILERYFDEVLELVGTKYEDKVYDELSDMYADSEGAYADYLYDLKRDDELLGDNQ